MEASQWWTYLILVTVGGLLWLWGYAAGITRRDVLLKRLNELDAAEERRAQAKTSVVFTMPVLKPEAEARLAERLKAELAKLASIGLGPPRRRPGVDKEHGRGQAAGPDPDE